MQALAVGFNEAAGIPRGRLKLHRLSKGISSGFNEAAGIPRGRLWGALKEIGSIAASMRPRVFPAEDGDTGTIRRLRWFLLQ